MLLNLTDYKRIAISGGHGVGKTTLAKKFFKAGCQNYIPEIARDFIKVTGFDWKTAPKDKYEIFELAIFYSHIFYAQNISEEFVSDRTVFDVLAYSKWRNLKIVPELEKIVNEIGKNLYDIVLLYKKGYTDDNESEEVLNIIEKYLKKFGVKYIELEKGKRLIYKDSFINV